MNNTFNFKRFNLVLAYDWKRFIRNFGITLLVWISMPIMFWVTSLVFDFTLDPFIRIGIIVALMAITVMSAPARIYGKVNLPREGVNFGMLPATNLEKFISMFLYCSVLTPVLTVLGSWLVDCLMTLLPFGGFIEYIPLWDALSGVTFGEAVAMIVALIAMVWAESSVFMFGNMIFKRRKAGKTFGWVLLINFISGLLLRLTNGERLLDWVFKDGNDIANIWIFTVMTMVVACGFYFGTYRKIKTQKY